MLDHSKENWLRRLPLVVAPLLLFSLLSMSPPGGSTRPFAGASAPAATTPPPVVTSWISDFESANLNGLNVAQTWGNGLLPDSLTTGDISGGALNMTFHDPTYDTDSWWAPMLQKGWNMQLDKTKHYMIRFQIEIESDTNDPIRVEFQWNDGNGDGLGTVQSPYNATEEISFYVYPNMGVRTHTFYTQDTATWPAFEHFGKDSGDGAIDAFWLEFGDADTITSTIKQNLDGHICKVHHIEFSEYTGQPEKMVFSSYFPVELTREVSYGSELWRLYNFYDADQDGTLDAGENYTVQYSGDNYISYDKKETASQWYPRIGPYDVADRNICEYHLLQAKACGLDGFAYEMSMPHVGTHADPYPAYDTEAMYAMADFVEDMHYEFQVGPNLLNNGYASNGMYGHSWPDRTAMIQHMAEDIGDWMDLLYSPRGDGTTEVYDGRGGLWIAGRPAFLFWSVFYGSASQWQQFNINPAINDGNLYKNDYVNDLPTIRSHLNTNTVWGSSTNTMRNPIFIGKNADVFDLLYDVIEGSYPITKSDYSQGLTTESPWTSGKYQTLATFVNNSNSYFNNYYYDCTHWNGGVMPYYMGGTVRGFDDHKGHSWGTQNEKRYISNDSGEQTDDGFALFESQVATGTPLCFVYQWADYKEGTGLDPNREQGFKSMEKLASRIWNWRGQSGNYNTTLLRMPERLLAVRKAIDFLKKAGYEDTDSEIVDLVGYADDASRGIHRLSVSIADAALDLAEADVRTLIGGLTTTWVDLSWSYPNTEDGLQRVYPATTTTTTVDGKTGYNFDTPSTGDWGKLWFKITDSGIESMMNSGYFVGRARIEYLDSGTNWIAVQTDNNVLFKYPGYWPAMLTQFMGKGSGKWRQAEFDVVNCNFGGRFNSPSQNEQGDLEVAEGKLRSTSSRSSALHKVRILGKVYEKP